MHAAHPAHSLAVAADSSFLLFTQPFGAFEVPFANAELLSDYREICSPIESMHIYAYIAGGLKNQKHPWDSCRIGSFGKGKKDVPRSFLFET